MNKNKKSAALLSEAMQRRESALLKIVAEENELIAQINKSKDSEVKKKLLMQLEEVNGRSQKAYDKYTEALTLTILEEKR